MKTAKDLKIMLDVLESIESLKDIEVLYSDGRESLSPVNLKVHKNSDGSLSIVVS